MANEAAPQRNDKPLDYKEQFEGRHVASQFIDPCEEASKDSLKCLSRNDYNREACQAYFQTYRDCKAAWLSKRREDRRAGRT